MKFRAKQGEVRIALTTGHVTIVTENLKELDTRFHAEAYAKGCLDENMAAALETKGASSSTSGTMSPEERAEKVLTAVKEIVEGGNPEDMTGAGLPKAGKITAMVGFEVTASERDDAYEKVKAE